MQQRETAGKGDTPPEGGTRALWLLAAGALTGLVLAVAGLFESVSDAMPRNAIARVNHHIIGADRYESTWRRLALDRRNAMSDADRAHVLKRMIEEELLFQRGVALGLVESDPAIRRSVSAAMIQSIVAEGEALQPDEEALREFYRENQSYFAPPETLHVRQLWFEAKGGEGSESFDRASAARQAIAEGLSFAAAALRYGDAPMFAIPDAALPSHKLQQYIGATSLARVRALKALEVSQPIESAGGVRIFQLVAKLSDGTPAFDTVRERVESAYRRDAADRALRDYLERLWREADVELSGEAPEGIE